MKDYSKTIIDFLSQRREKNVLGILILNNNKSTSDDIDLLVVKRIADRHDSGCAEINGIKVNYIIDDIVNLQEIIKQEAYSGTSNYLVKILNSIIVFDKQGEIKEFIKHAKNLNDQRLAKKETGNDINSFVLINKRINELFELINTEYFYYIYYSVLERIKLIYLHMRGIKESKESFRRITKNPLRDKRMIDDDIKLMQDSGFEEKYMKCIELSESSTMFDNLKALYYYCFGGIEKELLENSKGANINSLKKI